MWGSLFKHVPVTGSRKEVQASFNEGHVNHVWGSVEFQCPIGWRWWVEQVTQATTTTRSGYRKAGVWVHVCVFIALEHSSVSLMMSCLFIVFLFVCFFRSAFLTPRGGWMWVFSWSSSRSKSSACFTTGLHKAQWSLWQIKVAKTNIKCLGAPPEQLWMHLGSGYPSP